MPYCKICGKEFNEDFENEEICLDCAEIIVLGKELLKRGY